MFKEFLHKSLTQNGFNFSEKTEEQFLHFLALLEKWNKVFNLTAIKNAEEQVLLHIIDSLTVNSYLNGSNILDVGTGAGLPGIPLAIVNPDKHFTLLDSNSKKTRFLTQVVADLSLKNVTIVHARAEDFKAEKGFDTIVTRAFAAIAVMLTATKHLIGPKGLFLAMKGIYPEDEIKTIPADFTVEAVHKLTMKGLNAERCVVCIRKKQNG